MVCRVLIVLDNERELTAHEREQIQEPEHKRRTTDLLPDSLWRREKVCPAQCSIAPSEVSTSCGGHHQSYSCVCVAPSQTSLAHRAAESIIPGRLLHWRTPRTLSCLALLSRESCWSPPDWEELPALSTSPIHCGAITVQRYTPPMTAGTLAGVSFCLLTWVRADSVDVRSSDDPYSSPTVVLHAHADTDGNPSNHSHYKHYTENNSSYRCASARGMKTWSQSQPNNIYKTKPFSQEWLPFKQKSACGLLKMLQILIHQGIWTEEMKDLWDQNEKLFQSCLCNHASSHCWFALC